jgi:hypothetical protein
MAGFFPAIHVVVTSTLVGARRGFGRDRPRLLIGARSLDVDMDGREEPGHDGTEACFIPRLSVPPKKAIGAMCTQRQPAVSQKLT